MKRILIAALATVSFASAANAGSISLDTRLDFNSTDYNDDTAIKDSSRFYFKTGRVDYKGKLNDDVSFRARWAFTKNATVATKDSTTTAIELAYIGHKVNDMFSLQLGKVNSEIGGFETGTSSADLYLTSENYTRSTISRSGAETISNLSLLYMTGVKATLNFAGQDLHLIVADNSSDTTTTASSGSTVSTQNRGLMGIAWKGSFMDKSFGTVLNYYEVKPQGGDADDKHSLITAGIKYEMSPVTAYVEYHSTTFEDGASSDKDMVTSIVGKLAYTGFEQWTPRLEVFSSEDKREIGTATTDKYMGYGVVAEWAPKKEDTFRYHVAYNVVTMDPETGDNQVKNEFVAGARLMADFLK